MILKGFGVFQAILIQVISAQLFNRDLACQNELNYLVNTPLTEFSTSRKQIDNLPVVEPGSEDLSVNGFAHGLPFGNLPRASGLENNFAFDNGLQTSFSLNNGMILPNSSPFNLPFPNTNIVPQNKLLPNLNGMNINGLPFSIPNGLPNLNNIPKGLPSLDNLPNGLPSFNNMPNGLPGFYNVINGLPGFNNEPNALPDFNNAPNGLPGFNNVINGLPGFNNEPNALPDFNNAPNGLPGFNNVPNALPGLNNVPNGLPSLNNVLNGLPSLNNVRNRLSSLNNVPSFNNVPKGLPGFNNCPNNNNWPFQNSFLNLNNEPVGQNILNLNTVPAANSLSNINNRPSPNDLPSFHNLPCNVLPQVPPNNRLALNLPTLSPPISKQLPYLNNFRINEIAIGDGTADINRFLHYGLLDGNILSNAYNFQNGDDLAQHATDDLSNINDYETNKGFADFTNTPPASTLSSNVLFGNKFSSHNFPKDIGLRKFTVEAQNINNMQLNNDLPDIRNVQNYNIMPINEQRFVDDVHFNNDFAAINYFPADAGLPNAKNRLVSTIKNGMLLSNGLPETYVQNTDGNAFSSNDFLFSNGQVPVNNWLYDFVRTTKPANQDVQPKGVQIFSHMPSDHQSVLLSNNLNLAQELTKHLKIEGNVPFLNGLPVAGITETVTVLDGPYSK